MDYRAAYQSKLTTAQEAVKLVKTGDWVDYGFGTSHPPVLDQALGERMTADERLTDIHFRGAIAMFRPAVTQIPNAEERITGNSWHTGGIEGKLMDLSLIDI